MVKLHIAVHPIVNPLWPFIVTTQHFARGHLIGYDPGEYRVLFRLSWHIDRERTASESTN